ncbi:hypothetical protein EG327_008831 [Venturia inaequalis]|uniref:Uncharacterized protein n=2 Tax=Venturia inaequalis TaxID=5025 RepID=A0A8H3URW5_VENIN|nr:hypothetical protein EG327_008831 [Venturia inaequalis]
MMHLNTNNTLAWHLPDLNLLYGVANILCIVATTFLSLLALLLSLLTLHFVTVIVINTFRDAIRHEIKQTLKEEKREEEIEEAEKQQQRQEAEIAPWDSVSSGPRNLEHTEVEEDTDTVFSAAWEKYEEDRKDGSKASAPHGACWERFQKDRAIGIQDAEDEKWRRVGLEAETHLLAEVSDDITVAEKETMIARCRNEFKAVLKERRVRMDKTEANIRRMIDDVQAKRDEEELNIVAIVERFWETLTPFLTKRR